MAHVTVNLYAGFRQCAGGKASVQLEVEPHETIASVLKRCQVPVAQVRIVFCDNRIVDLSHELSGGETVGAFPAVGGG